MLFRSRQLDQHRIEALQQRHKLARKRMAHSHEVEKKNLAEKQHLQKQQLEQMQKLEGQQQRKQALYEEKKRMHDFKLEQKLASANAPKGASRSAQRKNEQQALGDFVSAEKETQLTAYKALMDRHTRIRDEQALTHAKFQRILEEDHTMILKSQNKSQKQQMSKLQAELEAAAGTELLEQADELYALYSTDRKSVV